MAGKPPYKGKSFFGASYIAPPSPPPRPAPAGPGIHLEMRMGFRPDLGLQQKLVMTPAVRQDDFSEEELRSLIAWPSDQHGTE